MGFSTSTSIPASSREQPISACTVVGAAMMAASTLPASSRASVSATVLVACGGLGGARGIGIDDGGKLRALGFVDHAAVVLSESSGADDGDSRL